MDLTAWLREIYHRGNDFMHVDTSIIDITEGEDFTIDYSGIN